MRPAATDQQRAPQCTSGGAMSALPSPHPHQTKESPEEHVTRSLNPHGFGDSHTALLLPHYTGTTIIFPWMQNTQRNSRKCVLCSSPLGIGVHHHWTSGEKNAEENQKPYQTWSAERLESAMFQICFSHNRLTLEKLNLCTNFGTRECRFAMYRNFICFLISFCNIFSYTRWCSCSPLLEPNKTNKKTPKAGETLGMFRGKFTSSSFWKEAKENEKKDIHQF